VVKAISEKPVSEEHAKLMADVKAKYEAYLKSSIKSRSAAECISADNRHLFQNQNVLNT